ncbi:Aspartyl/glutamyl-tRNA amidotransferase subunit B-related protein [Cordyceps fumosorosea ARSEF 2679]|uniref:Altered inheritance of mitochondria protein 41 n=1 Tax=Cordyceps fumosorosea (strain ARSEF 2679) TaxID=1081104 RepID=A0A162M9H2_CORFA|nr:Aspartyl/glutamyl-tRNA amidotransferase subunit B-related protein [Cordyceps fumosorosea ARSEF 2679]OAA52910.1 Aspartyl/glutamyl-tRNA amidotransferase subunit B-related protein [Cordyceps fumosorosea ARSEF 2679]
MSSRLTSMALRARLAPTTVRAGPRLLPRATRPYSSTADDLPTPPPLLQKLKGDLKTAMRAKDANRLSVLRAVMAGNLNASKTASPIRTDVQLVALMRRLAKGAEEAAAEARAAGRADLADKEDAQGAILAEYVQGSGVAAPDEAELRAAVEAAVAEVGGEAGKTAMGEVMKKLGVALEGKDVDKKALAEMVKKAMSS